MALLTDGMITSLADLQALDSAILETAKDEGVDLAAKSAVAEEELGLELAAFLLRMRGCGADPAQAGTADVSRVVVTPPLKRWHALQTLAAVYGDVYNSQLNDRYLGKWKHFSQLARETADVLYELGVGIAGSPVPRATKPALAGSGPAAAGVYAVKVAWRSATAVQGAPSEAAMWDTANGSQVVVNPGAAPAGANGYDVYAGISEESLARQNASPVPAGQMWVMPPEGLVPGPPPGNGQTPDTWIRRVRKL